MPEPQLVLASASPRRREILSAAGLRFHVEPADLDEQALAGEAPAAHAARLARAKALAVARRHAGEPGCVVIGADMLVVIGARVLGKPADAREAESHLASLCGRTHRVITAVAVLRADSLRPREALVESEVALRAASADEIRAYVETGEPLDKAGAYALQGEGRRFVERVVGSESNVIGLPLAETLALLRAEGVVARSAP
jgi:septum formation protein